jgi:hypothetical protein
VLSDAQGSVAAAVLAAGGHVGVARDAEEALACLDGWGIPRARLLALGRCLVPSIAPAMHPAPERPDLWINPNRKAVVNPNRSAHRLPMRIKKYLCVAVGSDRTEE